MSHTQNICPICTESFKKEEVLVRYVTWGETSSEKLGHLDCVLYLSSIEKRQHPPGVEVLIADLQTKLSRAVKELTARITKLGG